jgi:thiol-disulfide isomerase/thioredoxin
MKLLTYILFATVFCFPARSQNKVKLYTTADGKFYTQKQLDSIAILNKKTDSVYNSVFYYDSSARLSPFKSKFKDKPFPKVQFKSLNGDVVNFDQMKGKVVVVNFWSTTCGPCIAGFDQLNKLEEKYSKDVNFISIAPENKNEVLATLQRFNLKSKQISDAEIFVRGLGMSEFPKLFFVDKNGITRIIEEGVPVKTKADGTLDRVNGKIQFTGFERYALFLDEMIKSK